MRLPRVHIVLFLTILGLFMSWRPAYAQLASARVGLGFNTMLSSQDGLGFGFRTRIASPVNADLSFAFDLGVTGFILEGRDDATYVIDPQLSAIITFEGIDNAPYMLAGIGGYFDVSDKGSKGDGPTIHFGLGRAHVLRETTFFYEIDPALIIGSESVSVAVPIRVGIIF